MSSLPNILICNDDGVMAPGIQYLTNALSHIANVVVVAPFSEQSATSLGITIHQPLHINKLKWSCGREVHSVNGKPADCIKLALHDFYDEKPDLIVSGINRGGNMGRNVLYSGTVAAVIEGTLKGIPGIAFSCCDYANPDYELAAKFIPDIVNYFLKHKLPSSTLMNVNFPECGELEIKGVKMARQGKQYCSEKPDKREHPAGKHPYYWLGIQVANFEEEHNSDVALLKDNYVTAVPINVKELTHHAFMEDHQDKFELHFSDS